MTDCRGEPSLCFIYRLREEYACPTEAVFAVQTADDLGFNLRSSLKSVLSSTPSFPGGSIFRHQCTKPGPIWKAAAVWGTIQCVLADRQSQLGNDDCIRVSMLHANRQFSTGCHLMRLPHLSKESRYLVGEGPSFSFQYSTSVLWLSLIHISEPTRLS